MKKSVFPKIIYYLFTFALGLLLAFTLPYYFMFYEVPLDDMERYLTERQYDKAMELVGGYFNRVPVFQRDFDYGGGIVLFEAVTPVYNSGEKDDETKDEAKLHKVYGGFIYGLKGAYNVSGEDNNRTKLVVTDLSGLHHTIDLLDIDMDGNGVKEDIGSLSQNGFIYLDLDQDTLGTVAALQFYDASGAVFLQIDALDLKYEETFFTDINEFFEEYNRDYASDKLKDLDKAFREKNENYAISSFGDTQKKADKKAAVVVVVYFVVIYIIADFLVGRHYIIRFFKWVYSKTPRGKARALKRAQNKEAFGHDYYSQVTLSLDVSEIEDFSESVQVRYTNTDSELTFELLKENNYTAIERVKAGTYVNAWIDLNRDYAPVDMPENLIVEGYKMSVTIKIIKRKEENV